MAAAWPSDRSRTTARAITMPAEAPNAAMALKTASVVRLGASAQPSVARVNTRNPAISGMRRPKRSDRVPWVIWPTARPANQVARVSCAVPGSVPKLASTAGKAGKYMSVAAGPTAMNRPSREGSQVGWAVRVETWMLILAWSYGWVWMNVVPGGFCLGERCGENGGGVKRRRKGAGWLVSWVGLTAWAWENRRLRTRALTGIGVWL